MINKSAATSSNAVNSVDFLPSSSNTQSMMGEIVDVGNTLDTPMARLPPEMLHYVSSFLSLKDKINFNQALEESCYPASLDYGKILQEFKELSLTQKIDMLLKSKKKNYDFSKFYALEPQNKQELTDLFSHLFNEMTEHFRNRIAISEEIVAHVEKIESAAFVKRIIISGDYSFEVEALDPDVIDAEKIQTYANKIAVNDPENTQALVDYLFSNLAVSSEIRQEIVRRVEVFGATQQRFSLNTMSREVSILKDLLLFLKMKKEYRGMPVDIVVQKQKLDSSHLVPIMQKITEKMQTLPTEELRALLIMAADEPQQDYLCEKMIELGAKDNPFYLKGSPYFYALKSDLLSRVSTHNPKECGFSMREGWDPHVFVHHVAYNASDEFLRKYASTFEQYFQERRAFSFSSNITFFKHFYRQMETMHSMSKHRQQEYEAIRESVGLTEDVLSYVAKGGVFADLIGFLKKDPNVQNANGDTLLHLFIKQGNLDELIRLVQLSFCHNIKNLQFSIQNNEGLTPLMLLAQLEDVSSLNFLWEESLNLDVNQRDNSGNTALHHAIMLNKKVMIYKLLGHEETDTSIANNAGKTPYDLAESVGLSSVFRSLNLAYN